MKQINFENLFFKCRRIFLRDFELTISIGIHDFEKQKKQKVLIDVDLYVPLSKCTPHQDKLEEVLDYDFIRETILEHTRHEHIHLQETLCDNLAKIMLAHPFVEGVRISTRKTDVYPDCAGVGVETFLIKQ